MQVEKKPEPIAELYPRIIKTPSRLVCRFGWNEETTHSFFTQQFEQLELRGGENQEFRIPALGKKADEVRDISLHSAGIVEGLLQFKNLEKLYIDSWPKNGLDLSSFPNLRILWLYQVKPAEKQLPELPCLNEIGITGYSRGVDCTLFSDMKHLQTLDLTQGRLRSLQGLEACPSLTSLDLAYIINLEDITTLHGLENLEVIRLMNLPKVSDTLTLHNYPRLKFFDGAGGVDLLVDVSGLSRLTGMQKLWLNVPFEGLDWEDIFRLPDLKLVGITTKEGIPDDETLYRFAEQYGKPIKQIRRIGVRKPKGIQLKF